MNRHDVHLVQQIMGYPCISITLPTHRTSPGNRQDPVRVKNLVRQAADRLLEEFPKREMEPLLMRLEKRAESIDYNNLLDGLVLFANQDYCNSFLLPFPVKERVVIDETFYTRKLVYALNHTARYWTLVLSEQPTRLFECTRDTFLEVETEGFPITHTGPGGSGRLPGGQGVRKSAYRDEYHRKFFREIDKQLKIFMDDDPLPIALVGVDRFLSFFNEVTNYQGDIITQITGSHDKTSPHELAKLVWPQVESNLREKKNEILGVLAKAVSDRKVATEINDIWRMANEGRGRLLLVEKDFHFPARLDESGQHLTPAEDITAPDVIDDAVDEIIETVLSMQGRVMFLDNGQLEDHQRMALILRY